MIQDYRDADAKDVSELLTAVPEVPGTSEEALRAFTAQSFNREARDFRVVRVDGLCVALLTSTLLPGTAPALRHFRIVVHPAHRRHGIASELFAVLETQEAPPGVRLQCNSQQSWTAGNRFLQARGFRLAHTELLLHRSPPAFATTCPDGFVLRDATPADDTAWMALHREAYRHREDFSELTPGDLTAERDNPGFTLVVATCGGEVVGYCHAFDLEDSQGLINSLVVRNQVQRRGLGAALLSAAMAPMAARGISEVSLNVVSSNQGAIALYEKSGFTRCDEIRTYQRALAP